MPFSKLGLAPKILEGIKAMGYVEPTPIQLRGIPLILAVALILLTVVLAYSAWVWRIALAEREAEDGDAATALSPEAPGG